MKKTLLLIACGLPIAAHAQSSVTLYGVVDTGIQYLTNADAKGQHSIGLGNSVYTPSRFGIRGTEDLGGGLSAIFQLENGFNPNTGGLQTANVLFNRAAIVGLQNAIGKLTFGHQYGVQFDKTIYYDPAGMGAYSSFTFNTIPVSTLRSDNSVKFQSSSFGGLNVEAMYSFGQQIAGNYTAGRYMGAAAEYQIKNFYARVLYEQTRGTVTAATDTSGKVDNRYSIAARYDDTHLMVSAVVTRIGGDLQLTPRGTVYWLGGSYNPTPYLRVFGLAGRYDFQRHAEHPTILIGGASYSLSKSTLLYVNLGNVINDGSSAFGLYEFTTAGQAGKNQFGATVGIDHKF